MGRASDTVTIHTDLPETDYAYLAGIIDADGCVIGTGTLRTALVGFQVGMADKPVIDWIAEHFGGSVVLRKGKLGHRPFWVWRLHRQADLAALIPKLLPHMKAKGAQAWALLRFVEQRKALPRRSRLTSNTKAERAERPFRADWRDHQRYEANIALHAIRTARR